MIAMNTSSLSHLALILQTSSSALESPARKALEANSQSDFFWLLISTALVAVGIAFEYPEVRHEFIEWLRSRKKAWVVEVVPANRNRVPLWSLVGFLIVVAGIAGEGIYEGLLGINDTRIRKMDESSIAADELKITGMNLALETEKNKTAAAEYNAAAAEKDLWILGLTNQKSTGELASLVFAHTERTIDQKILSDSVAGKPKMRVEVLYKREDVESLRVDLRVQVVQEVGQVVDVLFGADHGRHEAVIGRVGLVFVQHGDEVADVGAVAAGEQFASGR
jgi:hypothetical protein